MVGIGRVIQFFTQTELFGFFFQFGVFGVNGGFANTASVSRATVFFGDFGGFGALIEAQIEDVGAISFEQAFFGIALRAIAEICQDDG